ncbi:cytochrome c oxidase accessory protein CcoG [Massilia niabensis]|uniref:Cytochrome c oxidase accessory protein CcoG n=1 Tax=Massilia niabensis TaxID=544910 RepID=A0ABW0L6R5_9BURK
MSTPASVPREAVIKMYAAREEIYPREAKGRYASLRWACLWLTQLLFYGLPWIGFNGRQAVLFDLGARKFHLFGLVLWPQDFIYFAGLLIVCAYGLFLVTTVAGRVWCGFACPQTVYTELFLWVERRIEGARSARIRLDRQPWNAEKIWKKTAKHAVWLAVALWTSFTFVGYFTPVRSLTAEILAWRLGPWEAFWVLFYGFATYGNAGWMREQVCKYMCPYARFQSAMFDKDTLIVTYDGARGDCIDCTLCVQVCPTGIDIRQGLQYECIGCAACVDACNGVMEKVGRPKGLIRYATENALARGWGTDQVRRRLLRPRVLAYAAVLALVVAAMAASLALRVPLKVDVIRDRGSMGREVEDGRIENVYRLQLMNTSEAPRSYRLRVSGLAGAAIVDADVVEVDAASTRAVPVRVRVEGGAGQPGSNRIEFTITAQDDPSVAVREEAAFIVPR